MESVVNARDFVDGASATAGIQEAIDALPASGGVAHLPPGEYRLRCSVMLRDRVTLRGDGTTTVLTRPRERSWKLAKRTVKNRTHLRLVRATGLKVGDALYVHEPGQCGYNSRHGIVRAMRGDVADLELVDCDPARTYWPERGGAARNLFPAVRAFRTRQACVENLTIDGGVARHPRPRGDFTTAAVHSNESEDFSVRNVTVRNWPADGIGLQNGSGSVTGCLVENCRGPGLHPGTIITHSVWTNNVSRRNTGDGLFFCLYVTHAIVQGNLFYRNQGHGIGGLADPDAHNVVAGNVCDANGMHGIDATRAIGNAIQGNVLRNNSQSAPGKYAGVYLEAHRDNVVTGNVCLDDQERPTQLKGVVSVRPAGRNVIAQNHEGQCPARRPPGG